MLRCKLGILPELIPLYDKNSVNHLPTLLPTSAVDGPRCSHAVAVPQSHFFCVTISRAVPSSTVEKSAADPDYSRSSLIRASSHTVIIKLLVGYGLDKSGIVTSFRVSTFTTSSQLGASAPRTTTTTHSRATTATAIIIVIDAKSSPDTAALKPIPNLNPSYVQYEGPVSTIYFLFNLHAQKMLSPRHCSSLSWLPNKFRPHHKARMKRSPQRHGRLLVRPYATSSGQIRQNQNTKPNRTHTRGAQADRPVT
ncbi:hypothetical protein VOLCADRAFT_97781 [Volvox carteri f. nagariensis]|uniref:Uncharacterized protein n=1 Tax=Volvox carteri f. nagariensis TaxID=3068 RepID=D8UDM1_VOLCA|nr:uncharacterized protein VOLCADRAFT_97781 [Volvox carteri f. nagariensis]EFJ42188.1 hypothetical protein VOLCADRAFT_97781 [Volvox carteri f. nagariensis]|eukprot:XP_002956731.1 hypothetical protein VOLCADRAFT_97781 [Volvox carteri f. nagariensis]